MRVVLLPLQGRGGLMLFSTMSQSARLQLLYALETINGSLVRQVSGRVKDIHANTGFWYGFLELERQAEKNLNAAVVDCCIGILVYSPISKGELYWTGL
ncbi:hypothetical protein Droror1_Dr00013529 [Drosera rotundifolia]